MNKYIDDELMALKSDGGATAEEIKKLKKEITDIKGVLIGMHERMDALQEGIFILMEIVAGNIIKDFEKFMSENED
ncbi:MAG: hypothetical protein ACTSQ8_07990 [Candidatus Helarchaeota archaeon]